MTEASFARPQCMCQIIYQMIGYLPYISTSQSVRYSTLLRICITTYLPYITLTQLTLGNTPGGGIASYQTQRVLVESRTLGGGPVLEGMMSVV